MIKQYNGLMNRSHKQENGILARVQSDMEKGNQSGKEGERSALYKLVEQEINHEIDETAETTINVGSTKPPQGWGKKRCLDGTIIGNDLSKDTPSSTTTTTSASANNFSGSTTFERICLNFMMNGSRSSAANNSAEKMKEDVINEEDVEKKMHRFMNIYRMDELHFLRESNCGHEDYDILREIGMYILVNIYCTLGQKFNPIFFKNEMRSLNFTSMFSHKLYCYLKRVKVDCLTPEIPPNDHVDRSTPSLPPVLPAALPSTPSPVTASPADANSSTFDYSDTSNDS